jgi:hypothetical protein
MCWGCPFTDEELLDVAKNIGLVFALKNITETKKLNEQQVITYIKGCSIYIERKIVLLISF